MSDPHPLRSRLAEIRRRVRQVLILHGLSWLVTVTLGAILAVGLLDWALHLDDAGVRLILGLGILAVVGVAAYRHLFVPLSVRIRDLDLALRIEECHPTLNDSLASTVQFLDGNVDPRVGSPALQQRVIRGALSHLERLDLQGVVQTGSLRRIASAALAVCVTVALVVGFNQLEAATALQRLMFPFAEHPWPKQTALRMVTAEFELLESKPGDPLRVARGDTLPVYVLNLNNQGRLPDQVRMEYRASDGTVSSEILPRATLRERTGEVREVGAATLVVKTPLSFRAVGGDDATPWLNLQVVPPPVVQKLQVTLSPPKYLRRKPQKLPPGVGHIEALVGTRVDLAAHINKPLGAAKLRVRDQEQYPTRLGATRQTLAASFVIREAGVYSYWLDLKDRQGFENNDAPRYEIRAIQDAVPEITLDLPVRDLLVTSDAEIPVRTTAKDDLGLKEIALHYKAGQTTSEMAGQNTLFDGTGRPLQRIAEETWQIAPLQLTAGVQVTFHTAATDDYDLGEAHVGRSVSRMLTIVSPEEKLQELADRQAGLLADLERASKLQEDAQSQVAELIVQEQKTGGLRLQDIDLLQRVELQQRQIAGDLASPGEGVEARTREMLAEMDQNHLEDAETRQRLDSIAGELRRIAEEHLPTIEQDLTQVRKDAHGAGAPPAAGDRGGKRNAAPPAQEKPAKQDDETPVFVPKKPAAPPAQQPEDETGEKSDKPQPAPAGGPSTLQRAAEHQLAVRDALRDLRQQLAQWRDQRNVNRELAEIMTAQAGLQQDTAALGAKTVTKPLEELTTQEQADLARLADRQRKAAENVERLQEQMTGIAERLSETDPAAAGLLQEALEHAQQSAIGAQMEEAARQIGENNVGQAAQNQQQASEQLRELDEILHNRGETDGEALVKKLKQAEEEFAKLQQEQDELLRKVKAAGEIADPQERELELARLKKEQQDLQERTAQAVRRLRRMRAEEASQSAGRAVSRMQQAQDEIDAGNQEGAAGQQQEALDDLEQARRDVAQERREAEEQLAQERLERIADELAGMISRQQNVLEETKRLQGLYESKGNWTRAQLRSLRDLAEVEQGLRQETESLVEALAAAEVFALALKGAVRHMDVAAQRLGERQADDPTQRAEQAALKRFVDLVAALKEDAEQPQAAPQPPPGEGEQQPQEQGPPRDGIPSLAQLKMLKTLQLDLNARTLELAVAREKQGSLSPEAARELQTLAQEQVELADLVRNLSQLAMEPESEEPAEADPTDPEPNEAEPNEAEPSEEKTE